MSGQVAKNGSSSVQIAASNKAILVDLAAELLPGYTFYFNYVYFDEGIRLRYLISPPVPMGQPRMDENKRFWIDAEAYDDLGNEHSFGGGAYGPWKYALVTDGVLSFFCPHRKEAEILTFVITAWQGETRGEYSFAVLLN